MNGANAATTGSGSSRQSLVNQNGQLGNRVGGRLNRSLSRHRTPACNGVLFGTGTTVASIDENTTRTSLAAQFDALRTQIDQL